MNMYQRKGGLYVVVAGVQLKHPVSRDWVPARLYHQVGGKHYHVREAEEFDREFHKIPNAALQLEQIKILLQAIKTAVAVNEYPMQYIEQMENILKE